MKMIPMFALFRASRSEEASFSLIGRRPLFSRRLLVFPGGGPGGGGLLGGVTYQDRVIHTMCKLWKGVLAGTVIGMMEIVGATGDKEREENSGRVEGTLEEA